MYKPQLCPTLTIAAHLLSPQLCAWCFTHTILIPHISQQWRGYPYEQLEMPKALEGLGGLPQAMLLLCGKHRDLTVALLFTLCPAVSESPSRASFSVNDPPTREAPH